MSNLWLNIRFGCWHLQGGPGFRFAWTYNPAHEGYPFGRIQVYQIGRWHW